MADAFEFEIVRLSQDSAELLGVVDEDVFDNAVDPAQARRFIAEPGHAMALACVGGRVIGMASGAEILHPDKQPQLFVNEVGVAEAYRNNGVGRALVAELLAWARERGCDSAWVGTEEDNHPARRCYRGVLGASEAQPFVLIEWKLVQAQEPGA